jgi:PAS domain S-box-containing protein
VANKPQDYTDEDVKQLSLLMQGLWQVIKQQRTKQKLAESEENYRTIIDGIQDVFYRSDPQGTLIMASPSMAELLGYGSLDELIGKNIAREFWFYPEKRQLFLDEIGKNGSVNNFETVLRRKDGRPVTVAASSHTYYAKDGSVAGIEGIFHDITAIRDADKQIQLLATLIDISPASVTVHDSEGRFIYANQRALDLHGYTWEKFMALNLHEIDAPASEKLINRRIESLKSTGEASFDVKHIRKDGSCLPLHVMAKMTRWNDRDVIMSIATDLSERMDAERVLAESEEKYRSLVETTGTGYVILDRSGRVITANQEYLRLTGRSAFDEIAGMAVTDWTASYDRERNTREVERSIKAGQIRNLEIDYQKPDGTIQPIEINASVFPSGSGPVILTLCRDITERKQTEKALREANHKLNLLNSMTRHDVTNQLTILRGFAQIAAMKKGEPVIADYLSKIISVADTIAHQIDFTRTYQELGVKKPAWIRIEDVIAHVESRVPVTFSGTCKGIELFADPMLELVFFNLFDNAVRHGSRVTEITIRCEQEPGGMTVIVEDNGTGITAEEKERIFDRGVGQNTGLGLFLVHEILSITGITIRESGIYGKGARFEISVPEGKYRYPG